MSPNGGQRTDYTVLVPVRNPETQADLVTIGATVANQHDGRLVAVTLIEVPDQTSLAAARDQMDREDARALLTAAEETAEAREVPVETQIVFTHEQFGTIFDTARRYEADLCVLGWGPGIPGVGGRAEGVIDELANRLPCDLLVFKDRGFDPPEVLLPTTGGPHTDLAASTVRAFQRAFDVSVTLLHVDGDDSADRFLAEWAHDHDLADASRRTETGEIGAAIERLADEHTLIVIGATEAGVLSRLVRGSLSIDVLNHVDCSVLIAERQTDRTLLDRVLRRNSQSWTR